jgi:hypothetical protein
MDPTTVFCPNRACAARGQTGQGNIGIHARQEERFMCTECRKTFTATQGTALYRLRTSAETVSLVVTLMAHGCPLPANSSQKYHRSTCSSTRRPWAVKASRWSRSINASPS